MRMVEAKDMPQDYREFLYDLAMQLENDREDYVLMLANIFQMPPKAYKDYIQTIKWIKKKGPKNVIDNLKEYQPKE